MSEFKYWAFLSYSHTDKKWADWLHKALETYRVPRRLIGKDSRDGKIPARVFPIFRDREELPVSSDLSSNINEGLLQSRYLIVVCSPRSAQSRWVGEEIKSYKKLGREDRILALIIDGEPNASDGKAGFTVRDECFHEAMRYRWDQGKLSQIRSEPIAADARQDQDGKTNARLKLLAGLLGVNYDDLKQREKERRARRFRAIAVATLLLVSGLVSVYVWFQKQAAHHAKELAVAETSRAETEKKRAESALATQRTRSESDFLQALRSIDENREFDALAQLARSLSFDRGNGAAACRLITLLNYRNYATPVLRLKHDWTLEFAEFSPDGALIVTASDDKTARVWDAQTGKLLFDPIKHDDRVRSARFSPEGRRIVTASDDKTARVWDAQTGKPLSEPMKHDDWVASARFSPDGKRILTASGDNTARIWDAQSGKPISEPIKHPRTDPRVNTVDSAEFSADGNRVLTVGNGTAQIWDSQTGKPLSAPIQRVASARFSPDGKRIVTASGDNTARIWDGQSGKALLETQDARAGTKDAINSAKFSPDGRWIVTAGNTARVWDAETGSPISESIRHGTFVSSAEFSSDGRRVVTASDDNTVRIWEAQTAKPLSEPMEHKDRFGEIPGSAQFSPNGNWIVTTSSDTARVWDVQPRKALSEHIKHDDIINSVRFSPDGKRIVTASHDHSARLWDFETAKPLSQPMRHEALVASAVFSPDGKRIVTASDDETAHLWNAQTGEPLAEPMKHDGVVYWAEFSRDGKGILTTSGDNSARVWDAETGKPSSQPIKHDNDEFLYSAEFSPDGKQIVTASEDETARIWDAQTGKLLLDPMKHDGSVFSAEFSRDGKRILTASADQTARLWDARTGKPLSAPMKHNGAVHSAGFSPDGKRIVTTTSGAGTAQLWDGLTGTTLSEPIPNVVSAEFSPDGKWLITRSSDKTTRLWDAQTAKPVSDSIKHSDDLNAAQFSPDSRGFVIASANRVRIWDLMPPPKVCPAWLPRLADAVAGQHLNDGGSFEPLGKDSAELRKDIKDELSREPADDDWAIWGRWFLADPSTRTISPFSKITVPDYIENRIQENTAEALDEAELLACGNQTLVQRINEARGNLSMPEFGSGKTLHFDGGYISFTSNVSEGDARKLGEYLVKERFFDAKKEGKELQLNKTNTAYEVQILVHNDLQMNAAVTEALKTLGILLQKNVFMGSKVVVYLCDETGKKVGVFSTP